MVLIANPDLIEIIAADLNSNDAAVEKLHELNNDPNQNKIHIIPHFPTVISTSVPSPSAETYFILPPISFRRSLIF